MRWRFGGPGRGETGERPAAGDPRVVATLVVCAAVVGIVFRAWMLASPIGMLDGDEAIVGLMARHMLEGDFPVFFWGQPYGGPHEAALAAALFSVAGSSTLALKLVPAALSAVAAVLTWRIGRRTVGEPAAAIGACLVWVWPFAFVWWSVKTAGFYQSGLVFALGVVLLALRLRERDSWLDAVFAGVLAGSAWWATPQTAFLLVPALVWLVASRPGVLRLTPAALAGAIAAAAPWLLHNLRTDWQSLRPEPLLLPENRYLDHVHAFFVDALPRALGLRLTDGRWIPPAGGRVAYVLLLALFVYAALRLRGNARLLVLTAVAYPFLFALSPYSWFVSHPRYLLFLAPVVALVVGRGLAATPPVAVAAAFAAALALTVAGLVITNREGLVIQPAPDVAMPHDTGPVLDYFEETGVAAARADYWLAYRMTFESAEEVVVSPFRGPIRQPAYESFVRAQPRAAYVFVETSALDDLFGRALDERGIGYRRSQIAGFVVYEPDVNVAPESIPGVQ